MQNKPSLANRMEEVNLKLPIVISLFCLYVFYYQALEWLEIGKYGNIEIYIISAILFFAVLLISAVALALLEKKGAVKITSKASKIAASLMLPGGGVFSCTML